MVGGVSYPSSHPLYQWLITCLVGDKLTVDDDV